MPVRQPARPCRHPGWVAGVAWVAGRVEGTGWTATHTPVVNRGGPQIPRGGHPNLLLPQPSYLTSWGGSASACRPSRFTPAATSTPKRVRSGRAAASTSGGRRCCSNWRRVTSSSHWLPRWGGSCSECQGGRQHAMVRCSGCLCRCPRRPLLISGNRAGWRRRAPRHECKLCRQASGSSDTCRKLEAGDMRCC